MWEGGAIALKSHRRNALLAQLGVALLAAAVLALASYAVAARTLTATARDTLLLITAEEGLELSHHINDYREFFREVAREELMEFRQPRFDAAGFVDHFAHFTKRFEHLSFIGPDGWEKARVENGKTVTPMRDLSGDLLVRRALAEPDRSVAAGVGSEPGSRDPALRFAYALDRDGEGSVGIMLGELPLERIAAVMIGHVLGQLGTTALVSHDGTILWHPRKELRMGSLAMAVDGSFLEDLGRNRQGFQRMRIFGSDSLVAHAPVPGHPWAVVAILPYRDAVAGAVTVRNAVFGMSLAALLLGGALAALLSGRVVGPIEDLTDGPRDMAEGS